MSVIYNRFLLLHPFAICVASLNYDFFIKYQRGTFLYLVSALNGNSTLQHRKCYRIECNKINIFSAFFPSFNITAPSDELEPIKKHICAYTFLISSYSFTSHSYKVAEDNFVFSETPRIQQTIKCRARRKIISADHIRELAFLTRIHMYERATKISIYQ